MAIGSNEVKEILLSVAKVIEENKQYLTDLDAAIGDGDHGINMAKGFKIAAEKITALENPSPEDIVKNTAMALISNVGGASGPLYGTMFLKASACIKGKSEIDLNDFLSMLKEGIGGVKMRGKSEKGEKTMLDVLIPVGEAVEAGLSKNGNANNVLALAVNAAKEGVEYTKTIPATKGRASYVGDRSIGHIDPGAMSSCLMIETIYNYFNR